MILKFEGFRFIRPQDQLVKTGFTGTASLEFATPACRQTSMATNQGSPCSPPLAQQPYCFSGKTPQPVCSVGYASTLNGAIWIMN